MTPLAALLARRIAQTGPISLAEFMADCLLHPDHGYYATRDPFGRAGDFTTAPEISQMFGELLALALAQAWTDQGSPGRIVLAEIGPGRGTLMADVLRTLKAVPGMRAAARPHLVEASPVLRERQRAALEGLSVAGQGAIWLDRVEDLPEAPTFLLANEFLDALPIRQFVRAGPGWRERMVGLDAGGRLVPGLSAPAPLAVLDRRLDDTPEGDVVELCPALPAIVAAVAGRVARQGGAAIFIDYGGWRSRGDTFQAVQDHAPVDPFARPGEADLTAHVDFEAVARAAVAAGAAVTGMTPQGALLDRLGIAARAERLARGMGGETLRQHLAAHRRLTHPQEMGTVFKALAVHPRGAPPPPGFDAPPSDTAPVARS